MEHTQICIVADTGPESDTKELLEATRQLRQMLLAQPVEEVVSDGGGTTPSGSKSAELATLGALVVTLAPSVFEAVVATVNAWAGRRSGRSAKVIIGAHTLDLTGISDEQTQQIIDEFWRTTATDRPRTVVDGDT